MSRIFTDMEFGPFSYLASKKNYWELNEIEREKLSNGCGPNAAKIDLVPDSLLEVDLSVACQIHDLMYHFGIDNDDKSVSDAIFLYNLINAVNIHCNMVTILDRAKKIFMREVAFVYYKAVADWGKTAFWANKYDSIQGREV